MENFEPKGDKGAIGIEIFDPGLWQSMVVVREKLSADPGDAEVWENLAQLYEQVALFHGREVVDEEYLEKARKAHEEATRLQPYSPDYHAEFAYFLWVVCFDQQRDSENEKSILSMSSPCLQPVLAEISSVMALDGNNESAHDLLAEIQYHLPELTFTPPPIFSPTPKPTLTPTLIPSITPTPTNTRPPSYTPRPTSTYTPRPMVTAKPTRTRRPTRTATLSPATTTSTITVTSLPTNTRQPTRQPAISPSITPIPSQPAASFPSWLAGFLLASLTFAAGIFVGRTFLPKHPNP